MACQVNQIFLGEVASVQNYGAFVRIPGCKQQGMIHKSQISSSRVDDVADVLEIGERVWCKVISIQDDGKVGLSMKYVNQGTGKDLDPNNVQFQLDEQKRKKYNPREERKAIVLEAIYKTTCFKCKTPGHLAKDCFSMPDGKKYELLPEVEDEESPSLPQVSQPQTDNKNKEKEKKHKIKKSKKRKKSKSKHADSDSESNDLPDEKRKKKKKKKRSEEQKKKKKKQQSSLTDSDSSSDSDNEYESKRHAKKCKYSKIRH
ncbi:zinc finger CCHC domain-containing protein 17-like [Phymastichus coffea]|uniref:zinc finger CCHC domain-containing protein 17-like n=1 Tax=Phymastichus coffea TaxID=108790 RepID=UPI00273AB359|nr:zinc finger CCHC domain-containing protein 17-like [Phymastichus coffea]